MLMLRELQISYTQGIFDAFTYRIIKSFDRGLEKFEHCNRLTKRAVSNRLWKEANGAVNNARQKAWKRS